MKKVVINFNTDEETRMALKHYAVSNKITVNQALKELIEPSIKKYRGI